MKAQYLEMVRPAKHSADVRIIYSPKHFRASFRYMSVAAHVKRAASAARLGNMLLRSWEREVNAAVAVYGDYIGGNWTSGCYNPDFPEPIKDRLRLLARTGADYRDVARAHVKAAGLREAGARRIIPASGAYYGNAAG